MVTKKSLQILGVAPTVRFLIVSLGNPLPEYASLHSAGHFVLDGLTRALGPSHAAGGLRRGHLGSIGCVLSQGPRYTLVRSPSLMNESGAFVARAWRQMLAQHGPRRGQQRLGLVLLHDELEMALGAAAPVAWDRSARGHNGVRSVQRTLKQASFPSFPFARVAVGIDRPAQRDSEAVARYVLAPISPAKRAVLEDKVPWIVKRCLEAFEEDWQRNAGV